MKQSMEITPVNSSAITYVGHEQIEGLPLTAVVFARGAGYLYLDPEMELHDGILSAESAGRYIEQVKGNYEFLEMSTCYPQALGNRGKVQINVSEMTTDEIMMAFANAGEGAIAELDQGDLYFILPQSADDDTMSDLQQMIADMGAERGRVLRGITPSDKALWVANIGELVLNFTVDDPDGEPEDEPEPEEEVVVSAKEFVDSKTKARDKIKAGRGKNLEKRWLMDDNNSKALLYALHMAVNSLAEEVGIPVVCHIPSDVPEEVSTILRKMDIPVYEGNAKTPPRNAGVMFISDGEG